MQYIDVNSVILDFDLYPRCSIDSQHTTYMMESLKAGMELPPIILDKKSKRVIDGFHRVTAFRRYFKQNKTEDQSVPVILKSYKSEGDMFADAMKYNATHGRALTQYDRAHCIIIAEERFGLSTEQVSKALSITTSKYDELHNERIGKLHLSPHLKGGTGFRRRGARAIPLKRTISHLAGKELTTSQAEANKRLSGMSQCFYVNQLIDLLENNLLDMNNVHLMERLQHLYSLLQDLNLTELNEKRVVA